jgi:general secretion pathway protein B
MSYILNALRKSEHERQIRQPEALENRILEKPGTVQKKNPTWLIILVIINASILIFFFLVYTKENINEGVGRKVVVTKKPEIKEKKKKKKNKTSHVHAVKPPNKSQISIAEQLKVKPPGKVKEKPEQQKIQRVERKKAPVITTVLVEEAIVNAPVLKKVTENINKELEKENSPPYLSELDYEFRRIVPEIDVNVFVFSENKEDRFIMIDMKKYLSGQQIEQGMTLKEIRINSLVVEYKNRVFQIQRY